VTSNQKRSFGQGSGLISAMNNEQGECHTTSLHKQW